MKKLYLSNKVKNKYGNLYKTSFESEDFPTDAYLRQTYKGKNVNDVRKDILDKYKGIINTVEVFTMDQQRHMRQQQAARSQARSDRILLPYDMNIYNRYEEIKFPVISILRG